jgi:hypothetical protein
LISIKCTPPEACWFYKNLKDPEIFRQEDATTLIAWLNDEDPLVRIEAYRVIIHRIGIGGFMVGEPDILSAAAVSRLGKDATELPDVGAVSSETLHSRPRKAKPVTKQFRLQPDTLISSRIQSAMDEKGYSIRNLVELVEGSYENMRRVVKGLSVPSVSLLRSVCEILDLPNAEMERLSKADKIRNKYGTVPLELSGKIASLEPVERVWNDLSLEQQAAVVDMVQTWAKQRRTGGR